jgi:hypothetical protein
MVLSAHPAFVLPPSPGGVNPPTMTNLVLVYLEMVLVSVQHWGRVCAKYTIGSEIILEATDGTPR